jgi:tetratricopeptide (TPR) repeat protein
MTKTAKCFSMAILAFMPAARLAAQTPADVQAGEHIQAAQAAEKTGDYQKAASEYQEVVKLKPEIAEVWVNLGLDLYVLKLDDQAIAAFQQALKRKPNLPGANLFMGMAYLRHNQYEQSIAPLKKAIALNPHELRAYINLSVAYQETGREEEAAAILQKAQQVFPDNTEVLYNLGRTYTKLVEKSYKKMALKDPDSYRSHQVLGDSYELRRDFPDATVEYLAAIAKCPDPYLPGLHYSLGTSYWMEAKWDLAIDQFRQELAISPENYMATWKMGDSYLFERKYDDAKTYLEKSLQQKPDLPQADRDMGKLFIRTGHPDQALPYLKKVLQSDPDEPTTHYLLAEAYRKLGNESEVKSELAVFEKLKKEQADRRPDTTVLGGIESNRERPQEDESFEDLQ